MNDPKQTRRLGGELWSCMYRVSSALCECLREQRDCRKAAGLPTPLSTHGLQGNEAGRLQLSTQPVQDAVQAVVYPLHSVGQQLDLPEEEKEPEI